MSNLERKNWLNIEAGRPFEFALTWDASVTADAKKVPPGTIVAVKEIKNGVVTITPITTLTADDVKSGYTAVLSARGELVDSPISFSPNATAGYMDKQAVYATTEFDTAGTYNVGTELTVANGKLKAAATGDIVVAKAMGTPYTAGARTYIPFRFVEPYTKA